jgi:hypothetical protein
MKCLHQNYASPNTFDLNVIFFNLEGQTNFLKNIGLKNSYNPQMIVKQEINDKIDNSSFFLIGRQAQKGNSCTACAIVAMCALAENPLDSWTCETITEILNVGINLKIIVFHIPK